jgi:hypothetical protein
MDKLYYNKYLKYKKKYLLLKQYGGYTVNDKVFVKFIGSGSFGCLICPPLKLSDEHILENIKKYAIEDFSFDNQKYMNCNYVAKIVALGSRNINGDSYEEELDQLLKIKELDPNGDYTPKLIYANIHKGNEILKSIQSIKTEKDIRSKIYNCIVKKIEPEKNNDYGYIILENAGVALQDKFITERIYTKSNLIKTNNFNINELINILTRFCKLLEFIKILFDKQYLHLDIKFDNITIKDNDDLRLIDFGRTKHINNDNYHDIIMTFLGSYNFFMYPFEPKIYINLLKYFKENNIEEISFEQLIELIKFKNNFLNLIKPYDIYKIGLDDIFKKLLLKDFLDFHISIKKPINEENFNEYFNEYIYNYLKIQFITYIRSFEKKHPGLLQINKLLYIIFFPIIKKFDMYCMGIVLSNIFIIYNQNYNDYSTNFQIKFENLIKLLLLNKLENVDEFIKKLNEIISFLELDLQWLSDSE